MRKLLITILSLITALCSSAQVVRSVIVTNYLVNSDGTVTYQYVPESDVPRKCLIIENNNRLIQSFDSRSGRFVPMESIVLVGTYAIIDGKEFTLPEGIVINKRTKGLFIQSSYVTGADNSKDPIEAILMVIVIFGYIAGIILYICRVPIGGTICTIAATVSIILLLNMYR